MRIQRAHRINVAEQTEDIVNLAGTLHLSPLDFEDLLQDESIPYTVKLDFLRKRVKRIAQLHLKGLGTPWAILEAAAVYLNATIVPEQPGDPLIKHQDDAGYSHKAVLQFDGADGKHASNRCICMKACGKGTKSIRSYGIRWHRGQWKTTASSLRQYAS